MLREPIPVAYRAWEVEVLVNVCVICLVFLAVSYEYVDCVV